MNNSIFILLLLGITTLSNAQVGIGTTDPKASLHIAGEPETATAVDGIIIPRITGDQLKAKDAIYTIAQQGAMVYVTTAVTGTPTGKTVNVTKAGYYQYNGSVWLKFMTATDDVKFTDGTVTAADAVFAAGNVGIGTTDPKATLDVVGNAAVTTDLDGIIPPRLTGAQLRAKTYTTAQQGAMVYVTLADPTPSGQTINVTRVGNYQFDGTTWQYLMALGANTWTSAGPVTFTAIDAVRNPGTAPTIDPDATINLREWKIADDGYVEETIIYTSTGFGGSNGSGYYIITPQFDIDTSRHVAYTGNLNGDNTEVSNLFGANIGSGIASQNGNFTNAYAIPISTNQIAIATMGGSVGNQFMNSSFFALGASNAQLKLTLKYKKAP